MTPEAPIHPACALCKGACCEVFALQRKNLAAPADIIAWFGFHGTEHPVLGFVYACACSKLRDGLCSIHATKPINCVEMKVGGEECRSIVALRRKEREKEIVEAMTTDNKE